MPKFDFRFSTLPADLIKNATGQDLEVVAEGLAPLIFGIFGHGNDEREGLLVRGGGSGVFIAPCYAITARHIVRDLFRVNPGRADDLNRKTQGYDYLPHWLGLFQVSEVRNPNAPPALWGVMRVWDPDVTDICLLEAAPDGEVATQRLNDSRGLFPEWSLLPPAVNAHVTMVGFPSSKGTLTKDSSRFSFPFTVLQGRVQEVFETRHDRGLYSFPGFVVNQPTDPDFSGGPVFHDGHLCGLVSGSFGDFTYVASLWPISLMEIEYPNLGVLNKKQTIGDWFQHGHLKAQDWGAIRQRVCLMRDGDQSRPYAYLRSE